MRAVGTVLRKSLSSCLFSRILTVPQDTALGAAVSQESSAEVSSEESRAEELRSRRRQRLANVKPSQPSKVVDVLATVENDGFDQLVTFQVRHWRFGFGKISPISSITPAVQYERPRLGNTDLHLLASGAYSLIGYQVYDVRFGKFDEPVPYEFLSDGYLGAPFAFDQHAWHRFDNETGSLSAVGVPGEISQPALSLPKSTAEFLMVKLSSFCPGQPLWRRSPVEVYLRNSGSPSVVGIERASPGE